MNLNKVKMMVKAGNELIDALRVETDFDSEDAYWELETELVKWINEEDLVNLTQLSHEFCNRCLDLEDEIN